jgi:hypothetical protein
VRRAAKVDLSQGPIVEALRKAGVWVFTLSEVGRGFPDLICWNRGRYVLVECKTPGEKINKLQAEFISQCPGEIAVVQTPEEALIAVLGAEAMR